MLSDRQRTFTQHQHLISLSLLETGHNPRASDTCDATFNPTTQGTAGKYKVWLPVSAAEVWYAGIPTQCLVYNANTAARAPATKIPGSTDTSIAAFDVSAVAAEDVEDTDAASATR